MDTGDINNKRDPYQSPSDNSSLEKLKKNLNGVNSNIDQHDRSGGLSDIEHNVGDEWERKKKLVRTVPQKKQSKYSLIAKLFGASVVFFVVALGIAVYLILGGVNVVSSDNVDIEISGPIAIEAGEELSLEVAIQNNNTVALESVEMLIEYPEGTRKADDLTDELLRQREKLENISVGRNEQRTLKSVLFGSESEVKEIDVSIEYRVEGSNAIFFKKKTYEIIISSSPILLTVDTLSEVASDQEFETIVNFVSNSTNIVTSAMVVAEYPFGFTFVESTPSPSFGDNVWVLGDVPPAAKRKISVKGIMSGQDGEERTIRFTSGVQSDSNEKIIGTPLLSSQSTIAIRKPFITTTVALNGDTSETIIAQSGKVIRADVSWVNNLPSQILDAVIEVRLNGEVLDEQTVSSSNGFYQSANNTIKWNKAYDNRLAVIGPGESGSVTFSFSPKKISASQALAFRDSEIVLDVVVRGRRIGESGVSEEVISNTDRIVKVATNLGLSSRIVYSTGPFSNTGGIPPAVENETTYTVIWSITNSTNDIQRARITASLPSYVRWVGAVSPASEDITFNTLGGQIVWDVGTVSAGRGLTSSPREVAFKVAFLPSVSQLGTRPIILQPTTISGYDVFTQTTLSDTTNELTTRLGTDPIFRSGDDTVTR
ncbi:hypothetical protein COB55_00480 [Candidatus Wolfebacteria bacterium]|nr:MAG: hypothetical protein COB55_00480 [Candidatus Wolfebacteria bacterium]